MNVATTVKWYPTPVRRRPDQSRRKSLDPRSGETSIAMRRRSEAIPAIRQVRTRRRPGNDMTADGSTGLLTADGDPLGPPSGKCAQTGSRTATTRYFTSVSNHRGLGFCRERLCHGDQCERAAIAFRVEAAAVEVAVNELRVLADRAEDPARIRSAERFRELGRWCIHGHPNVGPSVGRRIGRTSRSWGRPRRILRRTPRR